MSRETWTTIRVVQWAVHTLKQKSIVSARLDAELLAAHVLGTDRMGLYLQYDRPFTDSELADLKELIQRRVGNEPVPYLIGWREFFGLRFAVTPDVLIPRPESEQLVEEALRFMKDLSEDRRTVLDLGTGSGCLAVAIAKNINCRIWAVDTSEAALVVARKNARDLHVEGPIIFRKGSWYEALTQEDPPRFSVIMSNPPYVFPEEKDELAPDLLKEPDIALFAGMTGLEAYEAISRDLTQRLEKGGCALMELNAKYADKIMGFFHKPDLCLEVKKDLNGLPRVLVIKEK